MAETQSGISAEDLKELNQIFKDMGGVDSVEGYASGNFERLPDGDYLGEIDHFETTTSKTSGKPMAVIVVATESKMKEYVYLMLAGNDLEGTKRAIGRSMAQLKKLGLSGPELNDMLEQAEKLVGTKVVLHIKTTVSRAGNEFRNVDIELS